MKKKLLLSLPYLFRQNKKKIFKNGPIAGPEMESCPRLYSMSRCLLLNLREAGNLFFFYVHIYRYEIGWIIT